MAFALTLAVAACTFCSPEIVKKQTVYETQNFYVLADYAPITPGHLLILPKKHVKVLQDLDPKVGSELITLFKKVEEAFEKVEQTEQYIVLEKNGKEAGQSIEHLHFHMIPIQSSSWKFFGQMKVFFRIILGSRPAGDKELAETVNRFRGHFYKEKATKAL